MTQDGSAPGVQYWFVRLDEKLDKIDEKLDGQGEEIAEHRMRLGRVEKDIDTLHSLNQVAEQHRHEERRHRAQIKWLVITSLIMAVAGIAGGLIALLAH